PGRRHHRAIPRREGAGRARGGRHQGSPLRRRAVARVAADRRRRRVARTRSRGGRQGHPGVAAPRDARGLVPARGRGRRCLTRSTRGTHVIGRIWAIALNTFREAVRIRVIYGILVLLVGVNLLSLVLGSMTSSDSARVTRDVSLAGISLFG